MGALSDACTSTYWPHHAAARLTNDCTTCLLTRGDCIPTAPSLLLAVTSLPGPELCANARYMTETALCLQDTAGKETNAVCLRQGTCPRAAATCVGRRPSQQGRRATEGGQQEQCFDFWRKSEPGAGAA